MRLRKKVNRTESSLCVMKWSSLINQYNRSYVEQMYVIMICYFFIYNKWILIDLCEGLCVVSGKVLVFFFCCFILLSISTNHSNNIELCYWKKNEDSVCFVVTKKVIYNFFGKFEADLGSNIDEWLAFKSSSLERSLF